MAATQIRALVAEDEPLIRMMMVEALEDAGFEVLEAGDGTEALRLIEDPDSIDFVVTDFNMPGFNGADVARRAREADPCVPVLFTSARADLLANAGAPEPYNLLRKPFTMAELGKAVEQLLHRGD